jgi:hyaluronate lyase
MINFWQPGTVGDVTASASVSVLIRSRRDGTAVVCVADPARQATELEIVWQHPVTKIISAPDTVTETKTGDALHIRFDDLTSQAGGTQQIVVQLD